MTEELLQQQPQPQSNEPPRWGAFVFAGVFAVITGVGIGAGWYLYAYPFPEPSEGLRMENWFFLAAILVWVLTAAPLWVFYRALWRIWRNPAHYGLR